MDKVNEISYEIYKLVLVEIVKRERDNETQLAILHRLSKLLLLEYMLIKD